MPEKDNKKEQVEVGNQLPEGPTIDNSNAVDDAAKKAIADAFQQLNGQEQTRAQMISDTYDSPIQETQNIIKNLEQAKRDAQSQDETIQRKSAAFKMAAGISDSLAALGNLIGVSQGGSNIDMGGGALTPMQQRFDAARKERKADIKSINDRLEQYRNQLLQMQIAKGGALAAAAEADAGRAFTTSERLATQAWTSGEKEKDRTADATIASAKMANDSYQKALDRAKDKDVATIRSGNKGGSGAKTGFILTEEDGTQAYYEMDEARAEAIITKMGEAMASDLANENVSMELKSAWDAYQKLLLQERVGVGADEELEDARNKVINLSPYMRKLITGESFKKAPKTDEDEFSGNRVG